MNKDEAALFDNLTWRNRAERAEAALDHVRRVIGHPGHDLSVALWRIREIVSEQPK